MSLQSISQKPDGGYQFLVICFFAIKMGCWNEIYCTDQLPIHIYQAAACHDSKTHLHHEHFPDPGQS